MSATGWGKTALLLPLLLALTACPATHTIPVRERPLGLEDPRARDLLSGLVHSAQIRSSLRGVARLALDGPDGAGRATQIVMLERPARLRVEVLGFLNQTVAVLTTDGDRFQLFQAEDRSHREGAVRPGLLGEIAGLSLTPRDAVGVLLGTPALPRGAQLIRAASLSDGGTRLDLGPGGGSDAGAVGGWVRLRLDFDAASRLRRWAYLDAAGEAFLETRFDAYRYVSGLPFAHEIELRDRRHRTSARLRFADVELNPELPPTVFRQERETAG